MESSSLIKRAIRDLPLHVHDALYSGDSRKPVAFVGMSGGVDSSVSAYVLRQAGFDVVGVFIKTWQPEGQICTWKDDRRDAMRVCAELGIPFRTLDLEQEYKQNVADYMIREYAAGRTPNPDIMCNKHVKFGGFFEYAMAEGADFVATGHYARTRNIAIHGHRIDAADVELVQAADEIKDQTYFLWAMPKGALPRLIFPIGALLKSEVRVIAKETGLPVFDKKDSQGVCFMGELDMKEFLKQNLKPAPVPGIVIDMGGKTIGSHEGAVLYTIGERHGFSIQNETADAEPRFIISKDIASNILRVGSEKDLVKADRAERFLIGDVNFLSKNSKLHGLPVMKAPKNPGILGGKPGQAVAAEASVRVRLRHRQQLQRAFVSAAIDDHGVFCLSVRCEEPQQGIASGQSCVLYDGDVCLGGGIIQ